MNIITNIILMAIIICPIIYTFSYAGYNWKNKNPVGVAGALILAFAAILLSIFLLF